MLNLTAIPLDDISPVWDDKFLTLQEPALGGDAGRFRAQAQPD